MKKAGLSRFFCFPVFFPVHQEIISRCLIQLMTKTAETFSFGNRNICCNIFQRNILRVVFMDEIEHLLKSFVLFRGAMTWIFLLRLYAVI